MSQDSTDSTFTMVSVEESRVDDSRTSTEESIKPEVNQHFYFEDSQIVLQVEGQRYKIHRYFLTRESQTFRDLFSLCPPEDSTSVEGSEVNPVRVPETLTNEFETLLRFLYFGMHDDYSASLADWIAILSVSTRWTFEKVRERAIKEITACLDQIDPFELIGLADKYNVEQWLKSAYRRLVKRDKLITNQEALRVSFPRAIMLMRSREQYWKDKFKAAQQHRYYNFEQDSPDTIISSQVRIMEMEMASVEMDAPKTEPKTGLSQLAK